MTATLLVLAGFLNLIFAVGAGAWVAVMRPEPAHMALLLGLAGFSAVSGARQVREGTA